MKLIREREPFGLDQSVIETLEIPGIIKRDGMALSTEMLEVTSYTDSCRKTIPGPTTLLGENGESLMVGDGRIIDAALKGGGIFHWIENNPVYTAQTREDYEAEQEAERLAEEQQLAYW